MLPNLDQTFSTPANAKTSVYFMWDFVGRTLYQLYLVPADTHNLSPWCKEAWEDVPRGGGGHGVRCYVDFG